MVERMRRTTAWLGAGLVVLSVVACADDDSEVDAAEWIAFSSSRTAAGDIYAVEPLTGEIVRLAGTELPEGTPRYDAARKRIVFNRFYEDEGRAAIVAGGAELFDDPTGETGVAWSPSGDAIAYAMSRDGREDLFTAAADGSDERRLTDDPEIDRYPAWSPDGTRIAFARRTEGGWELFVLENPSGTPELRRLTDRGAYVGHVAWSPDGSRIAFDTQFDDHADIAMLELATGTVTRLTERPGNDLVPSWSADGHRVAFAGVTPETGNWDVWTVDVETLELTRLTRDPAFDGGPAYVPENVVRDALSLE